MLVRVRLSRGRTTRGFIFAPSCVAKDSKLLSGVAECVTGFVFQLVITCGPLASVKHFQVQEGAGLHAERYEHAKEHL